MEVFIGGLPISIKGNVTALKPQTLEEAITITQRLMDQIKFKVKDFIQAIKESSCKRRSKLAFENADFEFESRVDTFRDKEIYLVI
ncbi:hypothetical protein Tco_1457238 [Tanacetum coccineum]